MIWVINPLMVDTENTKSDLGFSNPHIIDTEKEKYEMGFEDYTLRSTFDRECKTLRNSGSFRIALHLPGPCLATPAFSAASSSDVHFSLGAPICCRESPGLL